MNTDRRAHIFARDGQLRRAGSSAAEVWQLSHPGDGSYDRRGINRVPENVARRHEIARHLQNQGLSLPEIAQSLGYSAHSTVAKALTKGASNDRA